MVGRLVGWLSAVHFSVCWSVRCMYVCMLVCRTVNSSVCLSVCLWVGEVVQSVKRGDFHCHPWSMAVYLCISPPPKHPLTKTEAKKEQDICVADLLSGVALKLQRRYYRNILEPNFVVQVYAFATLCTTRRHRINCISHNTGLAPAK